MSHFLCHTFRSFIGVVVVVVAVAVVVVAVALVVLERKRQRDTTRKKETKRIKEDINEGRYEGRL